MEESTKKKLIYTILILSSLGFLISLYQTYSYFRPSSSGSFCDFSASISCSAVTKSAYARFLNIPIALFGVLGFLLLMALAWKSLQGEKLLSFLHTCAIMGVLFSIYLMYAEFQLQALCPLCTIVHLLLLIIAIIAYQLKEPEISFFTLPRPWLTYIISGIIFLLLIFNVFLPKPNQDTLAQCLTEKGVVMYSSYLCSHCQETKDMFGTSMKYIHQVECHPQGPGSQTALCQQKKIEGTPTWIIEQQGREIKRHVGFLTLDGLRQFAAC